VFRIFKPQSQKKRSILAKQKIKPSQKASEKSASPGKSRSFAAKASLLLLLFILMWGVGIRIYDKINELASYLHSVVMLPPREWRIEVISAGGTPLPEDIRREVYKVASKFLKQGSPGELSLLSRQVESLGMLESVKVIRPLSDAVILSAELRRPALLIQVGSKTRFLTMDGAVFGDALDNSGNPSAARPTVLVSGIFDQRPNPSLDTSLRIITTGEERRHLANALEIWQRSADAGIEIKMISFQKFRGFALTLPGETEIVIGIAPFDYKLKKLRGILDGLAREGIVASRIELDYEGKAFIKERKL